MKGLAARAGPVRLALLIAALALAVPFPVGRAEAQPDPAAKIRVESTTVNLSEHPAFTFVIGIPTVLEFTAIERNGQRFLRVFAISRVDSLKARISKATRYLTERPGIFTPLFDPPNTQPIMGYVDRLQFERALRGQLPKRTLSYNRRLT